MMAFDGLTVAALVEEFSESLTGGRIYKIAQTEPDELLLTIKTRDDTFRLLISASPSLPLMRLTDSNKPAPLTAPGFCMLLRKHLQNGRITRIWQPSLERCVHIEIEHLNEMGDLRTHSLIVELMGKHSNIIFCDGDTIVDAIRHVPGTVSSVREVLPGRPYFLPNANAKLNPREMDEAAFTIALESGRDLINVVTGISPLLARELYFRSQSDKPETLYQTICTLLSQPFSPTLYSDEYAAVPLLIKGDAPCEHGSMSEILTRYYARKESATRIKQKSSDLRHIVQTALERNVRKLDLQTKQLKDTEKRDKYKIYGELLTAYGYEAPENADKLTCLNYYNNEEITIPLDPSMTPLENAQNYFKRYNKLKRTYEALSTQIEETASDVAYLRSVTNALEFSETESDLSEIRQELTEAGYIRARSGSAKKGVKAPKPGKPLHYVSSDGFDIYVGKNNLQNEYLTHKLATGNDWWFHSKSFPGSHVIVLAHNEELPDRTFEEAASLAAHYSGAGRSDKVEIDYVQKKHLKKANGGKPGFVIYHTNYSMLASTDISGIQTVEESGPGR